MLPANRANRRFSRTAFALIVFCIGLAKVNPAVKIVSPVKNQIIKYRNQSVLFNCTVTPGSRVNGTNVQWLRNDTVYEPPGKIDTPYWSSFVLRKGLQLGDEGEYKCTSVMGSDTVEVHLAEKPKASAFGYSSPVVARLDDRTELKCHATGWPVPNITWIRNGRNILDINQDNQYEVYVPPGADYSVLAIRITQWKHEGQYICMARNVLGEDNDSIEVQIEAPKTTMKAEKAKYTAIVGTEAKLVCIGEEVMNDDDTSLSWGFNGTEVKNSSDHYLIINHFYTTGQGNRPIKVRTHLSVLNLGYADSGNYNCRIVNLGRKIDESDTITLEVKAEDKGKRLKPWMIAVISVVAAIVFLLLAALIIFACLRRRGEKKLLAIAQKYDQEEYVFEHDLFISYSTKDYDWVQQSLLPVLDENGIKYIIHSRDFVPGKAWLDNMADSVYNSRKVILVMSMNYLSSGFCKDEMRMAIHRCSERDDSSLIVVRIDNIKSSVIPKSLRHRTFIDVTSREETTTWQRRILEYVRSVISSGSVASDESFNEPDTKSLLSMFKLKSKKKRNNAERELENQAEA